MNNRRRLIFIASLERSGSTLLDLTLGGHPRLVSFGEVARVLKPHGFGGIETVMERHCSCGERVGDCLFWSGIVEQIKKKESDLTLSERYNIFLEKFNDIYGEDKIPVDSSKFYEAMDSLRNISGLDAKVIFMVRDVRGWCSSSLRAEKRKKEIPYGKIFSKEISHIWLPYIRFNVLRKIPLWLPLEWYLRNMRIERYVKKLGFEMKYLSYESLTLNTDETLNNIYSFLDLGRRVGEKKRDSHIVRGNRMAFDPIKNKKIFYDATWLEELWTQYSVAIWPFVMAKNREWYLKGKS